jgi:hypothetical protein
VEGKILTLLGHLKKEVKPASETVKFEVLTATSMKMAVLWDVFTVHSDRY